LTDNPEWKAIQESKGGCMPLILVVLLVLSSYAFAVEAPLFQKLQTGDSIYVTYSSNGCFHSVTYEFEFKHGVAVTAEITEVELVPGTKGKDSREEIRTLLGTVTLTASELAGLDRLFEFYRKGEWGGCTTQDSIKATYKIGGVTTATETFTDRTCAAATLRNVTLLETFPEKLKKKPK
jgi:hypothetical protein